MNPSYFRGIGKFLKALACGAASATAAGTGDNTAVTGATIDRLGYNSAKVAIAYKTSLTADKTLSFAVEYQESSDGTTWDTAVALQTATVAETGAKTNEVGEVTFDVDLSGLKRYVRFNFTPDLSHSGTDTVVCACTAILGGAVELPAA
jgi:hypothetical protein